MTLTTKQERAEFEAVIRGNPSCKPELLNWLGDRYEFDTMESAWQGFRIGIQAARRAPAVPVPQSIEQMAVDRYKVVPSHSSMFYPCAVVAGDGQQQLYTGRAVECQNMARKFTGAFLDGAFVALAAAPQPPGAAPVPQGWKLVPVELLDRATESLGSFVSDHGWGQADMDTFDDLSALAADPKGQLLFHTQTPDDGA